MLSAEDAELVRRLVGVDEVRAATDMGTAWPAGDAKVAIYAEHAPAEGYAQSRHELKAADAADRRATPGTGACPARPASSSSCACATPAPRSTT